MDQDETEQNTKGVLHSLCKCPRFAMPCRTSGTNLEAEHYSHKWCLCWSHNMPDEDGDGNTDPAVHCALFIDCRASTKCLEPHAFMDITAFHKEDSLDTPRRTDALNQAALFRTALERADGLDPGLRE
eukprot:2450385-Amphidinium_carterae.1